MDLPRGLITVTPLSKAIALSLFVTLPFVGFYFGVQYGQVEKSAQDPALQIAQDGALQEILQEGSGTDEYADQQVYNNEEYGFEISFPLDWYAQETVSSNDAVEFLLLFSDLGPIHEEQGLRLTHPWQNLSIRILSSELSEEVLSQIGKSEGTVVVGEVQGQVEYAPITFQGRPANKAMHVSPTGVGGDPPLTYIRFNANGRGWSVEYPNTDFNGSHDPVFDSILSTLTILE